MKVNIFFILTFLLIASCKTNPNIEEQEFISLEKISDKKKLALFKYVYPINRTYFSEQENKKH